MNILIITTYYPPDTAIAAVRPYMFAKYLAQMGHTVTVLRSGMLDCTADRSLTEGSDHIRIISYMGKDAPAERFERGEIVKTQFSTPPKPTGKLPYGIRNAADKAFRALKSTMVGMKVVRAKKRFTMQKACIDSLTGEQFDAVFATYSQLENVYAGKYAAEKFGCKWILDFRDPIARRSDGNYLTYLRWKKIQEKAVRSADICTAVSEGVASKVGAGSGQHIQVLYNGYDGEIEKCPAQNDNILRFCYTGVMYQNRSSADALFRVLGQLQDEEKLDLNNVCFEYAGPHVEMIYEQAKKHGVERILVNHGFVSRQDAVNIQVRSDIFLVLTWNTAYEQGVLTGKFFEGIRARKPILALVSGDVPKSELSVLNNKYHYGFCYEECSAETEYEQLYQWVEESYRKKVNGYAVPYSPNQELFECFTYRKLAKQLEKLMAEFKF